MDYSQYGEQEFILNYFGDTKGVFIDIGAADGINNSNTKKLIENGWCGLLVEPTPVNYNRLVEMHSNNKSIIIENCGCGDVTKDSIFYIDNNDDYHQISTFLEEQKKGCESFYNCTFNEINLIVYNTTELLIKHNLTNIDFISIDTEGYDEKVLLGIDFEKININLICVELITQLGKSILETNNFQLIHKTLGNQFYKKNKL
jgi:FkbM family methyltransferase